MTRQSRKKAKQPLTIMIVPYAERSPISLRIPPWVTPLVLIILTTLLVLAVFFASSYHRLQSQLAELEREREIEAARQREMRTTILSQQDEVRNLSTEVERLEADLTEIERISNEIRALICPGNKRQNGPFDL